MKLLLVLPWDLKHRSYRSRFSSLISYQPLTLATLASLVPKDLNIEIEVYDEMVQRKKFKNKHYDIVAISFVTSEARRAYELAKEFKEKGSHIVFGGYHTTFLPEEAQKYADTIIIGAGEISFPMFLRDFKDGQAKKVYDYQNIKPSNIGIPNRDIIPKKGYVKWPTIIACRSCPNNCEFCAISKMWKCEGRDIDKVIEEIKSLKSKIMIFFDPNFFGNRSYAKKLMIEMSKLNIKWLGSATINIANDEELLSLAKKSGCRGLLVGLESLSKDSMIISRKTFNDPKNYKEMIAKIQSYGIDVNGCFVLGLDGDREEELLSLPEQVNYLNLNLARFSILTPTPNSEIFKRLEKEKRILTYEWHMYSQNKVVFMPKNMTPERLEEIYKYVWKETYKFKNIIKRVKASKTKSLFDKIVLFCANIGFKFLGRDVD